MHIYAILPLVIDFQSTNNQIPESLLCKKINFFMKQTIMAVLFYG